MSRFWLLALGCALAASIALAPRVCRADDSPDKAAAEALYQLGQKLMTEGNYADACPKLEASQKLDPGVGTLLYLGDCLEKWGKLASAWATFQEAASLAKSRGEPDRVRVAELRAAALRPRLTHVVFEVNAGNVMDGFEVRRRGLVVSKGSWGVRLPTDAGTYEVVASAPGYETWRTSVAVPMELDTPFVVQVPLLRAAPARPVAAGAAATPTGSPSLSSPGALGSSADRGAGSGSSVQKTWGAVVIGLGVAGVVAGGVLTALAAQKNNQSKGNCSAQDPNLCRQIGVDERTQAKTLAGTATALGIGGGVVLAAGAVLYFTAPRDERGVVTGLTLGLHTTF